MFALPTMKKTQFSRIIMLIAGFIAVCAILLSPSFSPSKSKQTAKTEHPGSHRDGEQQQGTWIQAPVDAIPGTSAVKLDEPTASILTFFDEEPAAESQPIVRSAEVIRYLKVLFRTVIASNAP